MNCRKINGQKIYKLWKNLVWKVDIGKVVASGKLRVGKKTWRPCFLETQPQLQAMA